MSPPNRTLYVYDNLPVLRGINSESIDLIATDPPFNSKRLYNAPLGSRSAKQKFKDRWHWDDVTGEWHDLVASDWPSIKEIIEAAAVIEGGSIDKLTGRIDTGRTKNSTAAFLTWMAPRLIEMKRVLKPMGSIYLHCDPSANSYLRLLMDAVFGRQNFRNEIVWQRHTSLAKGSQHAPKTWGNTTDMIFFYAGSGASLSPYRRMTDEEVIKQFPLVNDKGERYYDDSSHIWRTPNMGARPNLCYEWRGFTNPHPSGWRLSKERLEEEYKKGNIIIKANGRLQRRKYQRDYKGKQAGNLWTDMHIYQKKERTGWSTQKPLALYERIIKASSNEGDVVLDPFCGCATTCVAAEKLGRQWVGIDIDPVAETITKDRLFDVSGLNQMMDDSFVTVRKHPPKRGDIEQIADRKMRLLLWKRQGGKCANPYCTLKRIERKEDVELDHMIPKSRGGSDDLANRIGLCGNCNKRKSAKAWGQFLDEERSMQPHPKI